LKTVEGLGGPFKDFYASDLTTVNLIFCTINAEDGNKEVGTTLNSFQRYLPLLYFLSVLLLLLFHTFFVIPAVTQTTSMKHADLLF
jgi:hypothetical protein